MDDLFNNFFWHSSIGIDETVDKKRFITKISYTESNLRKFVAQGENLLVHKTTKSLWKKSDDGKSIEAVFSSDILTEEDLSKLAGDE